MVKKTVSVIKRRFSPAAPLALITASSARLYWQQQSTTLNRFSTSDLHGVTGSAKQITMVFRQAHSSLREVTVRLVQESAYRIAGAKADYLRPRIHTFASAHWKSCVAGGSDIDTKQMEIGTVSSLPIGK